jgi:hypothetical protein
MMNAQNKEYKTRLFITLNAHSKVIFISSSFSFSTNSGLKDSALPWLCMYE